MTFDGKVFGAEIVAIVKGHVERSLAPLNARIEAMEKMIAAWPAPKDGEPGKSITLDDVAPMIQEEVAKAVDDIPRAVAQAVEDAIAAIPPAAAGKDADPELIKQMVAEAVAALPPAEKGKGADPVEVAALVEASVNSVLAGWDKPQDGKSITLDDVRPLIDEAVTKAVSLVPVPKDGVDGKDGRDGLDVVKFIRDDRGHLNGILRDGTTVDLGEYVGKDGAPGRDGADGFGFEDMEERVEDEGRTIVRTFKKGDQIKEYRHKTSVIIYREVFKDGHVYQRGDVTTFGGSSWHCNLEDTTVKPGTVGAEKAWTLMTKRGRDGKDGIMKPPTKPGPVKAG